MADKEKRIVDSTPLIDDLVACTFDKDDPSAFSYSLKEEIADRLTMARNPELRQELVETYMKLREMPLNDIKDIYERVMTKIREEDHWEYMVNPEANLMQKMIGTFPGECFWMISANGNNDLFEKRINFTYEGKEYVVLMNITKEGGKEKPLVDFYEFIEGATRDEDKAVLVTDEKLLDVLVDLYIEAFDKWKLANGW